MVKISLLTPISEIHRLQATDAALFEHPVFRQTINQDISKIINNNTLQVLKMELFGFFCKSNKKIVVNLKRENVQ